MQRIYNRKVLNYGCYTIMILRWFFFIKCNNCNTNNSIVITVIILIIIIIISIITQVNILIEMEHFLSNTGTKKHVHTYTTIAFMPTPINEFLCAHVWAHESVCMCALLLVS